MSRMPWACTPRRRIELASMWAQVSPRALEPQKASLKLAANGLPQVPCNFRPEAIPTVGQQRRVQTARLLRVHLFRTMDMCLVLLRIAVSTRSAWNTPMTS